MTCIVSPAQSRALEVVIDMIDRLTSNGDDNQPKFGRNIMDLILGILNVDVNETVIEDLGLTATLDKHPSIDLGNGEPIKTITNDNDRIQINIPGVQIFPTDVPREPAPWEPRVWYNQEPELATEVTCTGDKNCIVYNTSNTVDVRYNGDKNCITTRDVRDCTTYTGNSTGDFRDEQTSFNDK